MTYKKAATLIVRILLNIRSKNKQWLIIGYNKHIIKSMFKKQFEGDCVSPIFNGNEVAMSHNIHGRSCQYYFVASGIPTDDPNGWGIFLYSPDKGYNKSFEDVIAVLIERGNHIPPIT